MVCSTKDILDDMMHELPQLTYEYDALEPHIDSRTMEIHYERHHRAYVTKLNETLESTPELRDKSIEDLLKNLEDLPEEIRTSVRNFGGGHFNHSFFWKSIAPADSGGGGEATGQLTKAINIQFSGFASFREQFTKTANSLFGSGWTWLVSDEGGNIKIVSTLNQDSPISQGFVPLIVIDEWEHAYYLKYQNKRNEYVEAFWNVVNWEEAEKNFSQS